MQFDSEAWEKDGICIVRQALTPPDLIGLRSLVDSFYQRFLKEEISNYSLDNETAAIIPDVWKTSLSLPRENQSFRRWNIVADAPFFIKLVDYSTTFPIVLKIMGDDINLYKSQVIVVPSSIKEKPYLHTDAGSLGQTRSADGHPPLMLSIQYFLTDLENEDMGNFTYVPGSHMKDFPFDPENPTGSQTTGHVLGQHIKENRIQVKVKAGDAVIFPHSLWHGISKNVSSSIRKSLIFSYSKIFIRPYDYESHNAKTLEQASPRQRRLLGDFGEWYWRPGCLQHPSPDQSEMLKG